MSAKDMLEKGIQGLEEVIGQCPSNKVKKVLLEIEEHSRECLQELEEENKMNLEKMTLVQLKELQKKVDKKVAERCQENRVNKEANLLAFSEAVEEEGLTKQAANIIVYKTVKVPVELTWSFEGTLADIHEVEDVDVYIYRLKAEKVVEKACKKELQNMRDRAMKVITRIQELAKKFEVDDVYYDTYVNWQD